MCGLTYNEIFKKRYTRHEIKQGKKVYVLDNSKRIGENVDSDVVLPIEEGFWV